MMVVSILPVYAHIAGSQIGTCPNSWNLVHLPGPGDPVDKNGNEHICEKDNGKKILQKDDHILGKNKT